MAKNKYIVIYNNNEGVYFAATPYQAAGLVVPNNKIHIASKGWSGDILVIDCMYKKKYYFNII